MKARLRLPGIPRRVVIGGGHGPQARPSSGGKLWTEAPLLTPSGKI